MSMGTLAEHKFKETVRSLVRQGVHPTAMQLNRELGRIRLRSNGLNGREVHWLRQLVPGWVVTYGRAVKTVEHCKLFCCERRGDFLPDDIALTCSKGHLELVRLTEAPGLVSWALGGDRCTFCYEPRDLVEVQEKVGDVIGRSVTRRPKPPMPPRAEPSTIQMGLPVGDSPAMILGFFTAVALFFALVVLLLYFYG